jgi:hypothetical protein
VLHEDKKTTRAGKRGQRRTTQGTTKSGRVSRSEADRAQTTKPPERATHNPHALSSTNRTTRRPGRHKRRMKNERRKGGRPMATGNSEPAQPTQVPYPSQPRQAAEQKPKGNRQKKQTRKTQAQLTTPHQPAAQKAHNEKKQPPGRTTRNTNQKTNPPANQPNRPSNPHTHHTSRRPRAEPAWYAPANPSPLQPPPVTAPASPVFLL